MKYFLVCEKPSATTCPSVSPTTVTIRPGKIRRPTSWVQKACGTAASPIWFPQRPLWRPFCFVSRVQACANQSYSANCAHVDIQENHCMRFSKLLHRRADQADCWSSHGNCMILLLHTPQTTRPPVQDQHGHLKSTPWHKYR